MKKKLLVCLFLLGIFCFSIVPAKADSGWDYDYDIGGSDWGSDWSSSDWGSSDWGSSSWSSSYDDDWDSDYSSSYSGGDVPEAYSVLGSFVLGMLIFIIIFYIFLDAYRKMQKASSKSNSRRADFSYYQDLSDEAIKVVDPTINKDEMKQKAFEIYKNIQTAWMNFEEETIKNNTTDELYNMYSNQLKMLQMKKQKNIMDEITFEDAKIYDIKKEKDVINLKVFLTVTCYDYVVKEEDKVVVRGRKDKKVRISYSLTFIKSAINKDIEKCPNCGAEVDIKSSAICPYCRTVLVREASGSYVLSKKTCIWQEFVD